jgi:hypothetical protein
VGENPPQPPDSRGSAPSLCKKTNHELRKKTC